MHSESLRPGDLLFLAPSGVIGHIIDRISGPGGALDGDDPCHVAQVIDGAEGERAVGEMTSPAARIVPLAKWLRDNAGNVWAARLKEELTWEQAGRLVRAWEERRGRLYDYVQLIVLWPWLRIRQLLAWIGIAPAPVEPIKANGVCSQNVKDVLEEVLSVQLPNWIQSPADLLHWDGLMAVEKVTVDQ